MRNLRPILAGVDEVRPTINTTPLIDVMLVLLVMVMLSIPMMTHQTVATLPQPGPATTTDQPLRVEATIDWEGALTIGGKAVALPANPVARAQALDAALAAFNPDVTSVVVSSDGLAPYTPFVETMAALQRGGFAKVAFRGNEAFVN